MSTPYMYIFLADDDDDDKFLVKEALSLYENIVVEFFDNGTDLLKKISRLVTLPDMLFLDLNMPEMNGKECLQKIRADKTMMQLPIIIYSTSSNKKDIEETFNLGANLYVTKPNSFTELKVIIDKIVNTEWQNPPTALKDFVLKT